jgi:glyceraldehyde-3-phosphate dehydrogenase/erythrose-4-phosphate dehydrogenase
VRKVIVAAPVKDERALDVVVGVNDQLYEPETHDILTAASCIDAPSTNVVDDTQVKVLAWYDNEWGYANRLVELARKVSLTLPASEGAEAAPAR